MKLKLLSFSLLLFFSINLHAQKNEKDVEIIDFGEEENSQNEYIPTNYILKTSPVSFIFGSQMFEAERYINDFLSLQAGIGLTFNAAYASLLGEDVTAELSFTDNSSYCESDFWPDQNDICDDFASLTYRKSKPSFLLSTSVRLYFNDDAMDGSYFALKLRYSNRNIEIQDVIPGLSFVERSDDSWYQEKYNAFDVVGHYGYQVLYDKLTTEYFIGAGVRFTNEKRQDLGYQNGVVSSHLASIKHTLPRLEAGIRIGFQL